MRFFFDNNLSPRLARSLNELVQPEHEVVHLKQKFPADTTDEKWMRSLAAEKDWIIISGDLQIRKNPHEIRAWQEAGHTTFFLKPGWLSLGFWEQAWKFSKILPDVIAKAERAKKGTAFFVTPNSKIEDT